MDGKINDLSHNVISSIRSCSVFYDEEDETSHVRFHATEGEANKELDRIRAEARAEALKDVVDKLRASFFRPTGPHGFMDAKHDDDATNECETLCAAIFADEPKEREAEGPQVGDACLFWGERGYGIEYDVGLLSLHHNGEYYMRGGIGWKNCRVLARQIAIQDITRVHGGTRDGLLYKSDVDDRG